MPRPNNKSATGETDVSLNDSPIDADRRTWGRGANTGIVPRSVTTSSPSVPPDRFDGKPCLLHPSVVLEPAFADHHSRIRPFRNFQTGMVVDQEWLEGVSFADLGGHDVLRKEGALCDELLETDPELGDGCEGAGLGLSFESDTESESLEYDFEDLDGEVESDAELRRQNLRGQLIFLVREFFDSDPGYLKKSLSVLNKEAAAFQKAGDNMSAIAAYAKLFAKVAKKRLTHPELYVTHCNR